MAKMTNRPLLPIFCSPFGDFWISTIPWMTALGLLRREIMSRCLLIGNLITAFSRAGTTCPGAPSVGPRAQIPFLEDTQAQPNPFLLAPQALLEHSKLELRLSWMSSLIQTWFCLLNTCLYPPLPHPKVPKCCQERAEDITACSQSKNAREILTSPQ